MNESPFDLCEEKAYQQWRDWKLSNCPFSPDELMVSLADPFALTKKERSQLLNKCLKNNMVFYQCDSKDTDISDKNLPRVLGKQLGLFQLDSNLCADEDDISSLTVASEGKRHEGYIPYTNRPISWHTDGYYNQYSQRIRGMALHCVSDAAKGGENELMDHEMAYICMRDENPDYIRALMQPDVMTIPPNIENGVMIRDSITGPVFTVDKETGALHMRYTARTRSIEWKQDALTSEAINFLENLYSGDSDYILRYRLKPGQGLICNNVLHNRTGFVDDEEGGKQRLIYRARYYDRIKDMDMGIASTSTVTK